MVNGRGGNLLSALDAIDRAVGWCARTKGYRRRTGLLATATLTALVVILNVNSAWASCAAGILIANLKPSTPTSDFVVHADGTATHVPTGLIWKRAVEDGVGFSDIGIYGVPGVDLPLNWEKAMMLAEASDFAGYTDWRMPNAKELQSIVETCGYSPALNLEVFPNWPPGLPSLPDFWSSTTLDGTNAYLLQAYDGQTNIAIKTATHLIRLVRGGEGFGAFDAQADYVPDAFSFTPVTNADRSTAYISNTITVAGISTVSPISIVGGEYRINGGAFTSDSGTVVIDDVVDVRQTSSDQYTTLTTATLTIGGVSGNFNVTTKSAPVSDPKFPLPSGPNSFPGDGACALIGPAGENSNPAYAKPLGEFIAGGKFYLTLELGEVAGPVDVYIVVELPNGEKFTLNSAKQWVPFPPPTPFLKNIQNPVAMTDVFNHLFSKALADIPPGPYKAYLVMVPAGASPASFDFAKSPYYRWCFGKTF